MATVNRGSATSDRGRDWNMLGVTADVAKFAAGAVKTASDIQEQGIAQEVASWMPLVGEPIAKGIGWVEEKIWDHPLMRAAVDVGKTIPALTVPLTVAQRLLGTEGQVTPKKLSMAQISAGMRPDPETIRPSIEYFSQLTGVTRTNEPLELTLRERVGDKLKGLGRQAVVKGAGLGAKFLLGQHLMKGTDIPGNVAGRNLEKYLKNPTRQGIFGAIPGLVEAGAEALLNKMTPEVERDFRGQSARDRRWIAQRQAAEMADPEKGPQIRAKMAAKAKAYTEASERAGAAADKQWQEDFSYMSGEGFTITPEGDTAPDRGAQGTAEGGTFNIIPGMDQPLSTKEMQEHEAKRDAMIKEIEADAEQRGFGPGLTTEEQALRDAVQIDSPTIFDPDRVETAPTITPDQEFLGTTPIEDVPTIPAPTEEAPTEEKALTTEDLGYKAAIGTPGDPDYVPREVTDPTKSQAEYDRQIADAWETINKEAETSPYMRAKLAYNAEQEAYKQARLKYGPDPATLVIGWQPEMTPKPEDFEEGGQYYNKEYTPVKRTAYTESFIGPPAPV